MTHVRFHLSARAPLYSIGPYVVHDSEYDPNDVQGGRRAIWRYYIDVAPDHVPWISAICDAEEKLIHWSY